MTGGAGSRFHGAHATTASAAASAANAQGIARRHTGARAQFAPGKNHVFGFLAA